MPAASGSGIALPTLHIRGDQLLPSLLAKSMLSIWNAAWAAAPWACVGRPAASFKRLRLAWPRLPTATVGVSPQASSTLALSADSHVDITNP